MKIEVVFSPAESALLEQLFRDNSEYLDQHWSVADMASYVRLLAMHGADHMTDLVGAQCQGGEEE